MGMQSTSRLVRTKMLQSPPWTIPDPSNSNRHGIKRKTDELPEQIFATTPPVKRFVSEEEMSFEMRRLHIEANPFATPAFVPTTYEQSVPGTSMSPFVFSSSKFQGFGEPDQDMDLEPVKEMPRLFISEEVSKIQPQPVIPRSIIDASRRNHMAVVPWVPRPLPKRVEDAEEEKTDEVANVEDMDLM